MRVRVKNVKMRITHDKMNAWRHQFSSGYLYDRHQLLTQTCTKGAKVLWHMLYWALINKFASSFTWQNVRSHIFEYSKYRVGATFWTPCKVAGLLNSSCSSRNHLKPVSTGLEQLVSSQKRRQVQLQAGLVVTNEENCCKLANDGSPSVDAAKQSVLPEQITRQHVGMRGAKLGTRQLCVFYASIRHPMQSRHFATADI